MRWICRTSSLCARGCGRLLEEGGVDRAREGGYGSYDMKQG